MASKKSKTLSWHEQGQNLLSQYLKKTRSPKGRIFVLGAYGDLLLQAGKGPELEYTALGSICSSVHGAIQKLGELLRVSGGPVVIKESFWIDSHPKMNWLVLGVRSKYDAKHLKPIHSHLKNFAKKSESAREALDGIHEAGLEHAITSTLK